MRVLHCRKLFRADSEASSNWCTPSDHLAYDSEETLHELVADCERRRSETNAISQMRAHCRTLHIYDRAKPNRIVLPFLLGRVKQMAIFYFHITVEVTSMLSTTCSSLSTYVMKSRSIERFFRLVQSCCATILSWHCSTQWRWRWVPG